MANILPNCKNGLKITHDNRVFLKLFEKSCNFVNLHRKKILVTKADKNHITVIMDKLDYLIKARKLLNDKKTYQVQKNDPTIIFQNDLNDLVKLWKKGGYISEVTAKKLQCDTGTISKFYALTKVHKPDAPLRPIISACNSPGYQLSNFHNILSNVTEKKSSFVQNSQDFVNKVRDKIIPAGFSYLSGRSLVVYEHPHFLS